MTGAREFQVERVWLYQRLYVTADLVRNYPFRAEDAHVFGGGGANLNGKPNASRVGG